MRGAGQGGAVPEMRPALLGSTQERLSGTLAPRVPVAPIRGCTGGTARGLRGHRKGGAGNAEGFHEAGGIGAL